MSSIAFFEQDIAFTLPRPARVRRWIRDVIKREGRDLAHLNYIFCSDAYLADLNREYLGHKTLTDIITFDNSEEGGGVEGDVFISIDRVQENAVRHGATFEDELHRVMIHGVLHLLGYGDKSPEDKKRMREKEDACLSLRP